MNGYITRVGDEIADILITTTPRGDEEASTIKISGERSRQHTMRQDVERNRPMKPKMANTVRAIAIAAGMAVAHGAWAGDDLKNIGIGAGLGILGQIVQGKTVTVESALGSAVGAGLGSQIGDGSGAAVASVIGGLVGDRALDHAKGMFSGEGTAQAGGTGTTTSLAAIAGASQSGATVPVQSGIALEQGADGPQACEGTGNARQCFPVHVRQGNALILSDGHGIYSCVGGEGALECSRVP